jgi:glutaredoxin 3
MLADVTVYVTKTCAYCWAAKRLLKEREAPFVEIDITGDVEKRAWLRQATGLRTVPQIFIDGVPIGGYNRLVELDRSGELATRLHR